MIKTAYIKIKLLIVFISIPMFFFTACGKNSAHDMAPIAKNGLIDLSSWDFSKNGTVELKGEWKFNWMEDNPIFADPSFDDSPWSDIKVPSYWNYMTAMGEGYAWYRLTIEGCKKNNDLGIFLKGINTSYVMYINGKKITSSGAPSCSRGTSKAQLLQYMNSIETSTRDKTVIAIKVCNYYHSQGGMNKALKLGTLDELYYSRWNINFLDSLVIGIILMMSLYHFVLWFGRREDSSSLYFGLFCLFMMLRVIATNDFIERFFPLLDTFETRLKIEYLTFFPVTIPLFAVYLSKIFPKSFSKNGLKILLSAGLVLFLFTLIFPARVFSSYKILYQVSCLLSGLWILYSIIAALMKKEKLAIVVVLGCVIYFPTVIHDLLYYKYLINSINISQIGLIFFIFAQSTVLSIRFSAANRTAEHLSENLKEEVDRKTIELRTKTELAEKSKSDAENAYSLLNSAYAEMKNDLELAREIQENIFHKKTGNIRGLEYHVEYRPLIEIGGDIYDLYEMKDGRIRIFLSDATGPVSYTHLRAHET